MRTRRVGLVILVFLVCAVLCGCASGKTATFVYYGTAETAEVRPGDDPVALPPGAPKPRLGSVMVNSYSEDAIVLNADGQPEAAKVYIQSLRPGDKVVVERNPEGQLTVTGLAGK
jgi:hypothetical protein